MADQGSWFKLWDGWENDGAIAELSKEDMLHWVLLGGYLKKHGNNGMTCFSKPATALQKKLMLPNYEAVMSVLKKMPNCTIEEKQKDDVTESVTVITIQWKNWVKYQGDSSKFRVQKWRVTHNATHVTAKKRREEKREEEKEKKKRTIFIPPTPLEAEDYAKTLNFVLDGVKFVAHYAKTGWKIKGTPITDWQSCVVTWKKNQGGFNNGSGSAVANRFTGDGRKYEKLGTNV